MGITREINGQTYDLVKVSSVIFYWKDGSSIEYEMVAISFTGEIYVLESLDDDLLVSIQADAVRYVEAKRL